MLLFYKREKGGQQRVLGLRRTEPKDPKTETTET